MVDVAVVVVETARGIPNGFVALCEFHHSKARFQCYHFMAENMIVWCRKKRYTLCRTKSYMALWNSCSLERSARALHKSFGCWVNRSENVRYRASILADGSSGISIRHVGNASTKLP